MFLVAPKRGIEQKIDHHFHPWSLEKRIILHDDSNKQFPPGKEPLPDTMALSACKMHCKQSMSIICDSAKLKIQLTKTWESNLNNERVPLLNVKNGYPSIELCRTTSWALHCLIHLSIVKFVEQGKQINVLRNK